MFDVLRDASLQVELEKSIPGRDERPADLINHNWHGKTVALDLTIITSTRQSASLQTSATSTLMDQAARIKNNKSKARCTACGGDFMPFVADSCGALRTDAREMVSGLIKHHHITCGSRRLLRRRPGVQFGVPFPQPS